LVLLKKKMQKKENLITSNLSLKGGESLKRYSVSTMTVQSVCPSR